MSQDLSRELRISNSEESKKQRLDTSFSDLSDELTDGDEKEKEVYIPRKVSQIMRKCQDD